MRAPSYKVAVTIVYVLGLFVQILDATIVNVALPTLADEFGVPVTDVEWIVVGYLLALATAIPAAGWLSDRFGSKRVFLGSLTVFTVASGLCGIAPSLDTLVAARLLQGLGAGLITPVGIAILFRAYPLAERATAAAAVVGVAVIAPATGPALGGIIVDSVSWRWIFYVNLPIGILAVALGWRASCSPAPACRCCSTGSRSARTPGGPIPGPSVSSSSPPAASVPSCGTSCAPPTRCSTCACSESGCSAR